MDNKQEQYAAAGHERDRLIAEMKGWTDFILFDNQFFKDVPPSVTAVSPYGNRVNIPCWSTNLNWAWKLFEELPGGYTPRVVRLMEPRGDHMAHVSKACIIRNADLYQWEATADEAADAISAVWLAWHAESAEVLPHE